jgi:hypothetical protein
MSAPSLSAPQVSASAPVLALDEGLVAEAMRAAFAARRGAAVNLDPETVQHDLAKLVLTLVEFLRRLLEMQAVRRMEAGSLTEDEEERVGLTLMKAREQVLVLAEQFGLSEKDLTLDLGPLGRLM